MKTNNRKLTKHQKTYQTRHFKTNEKQNRTLTKTHETKIRNLIKNERITEH